MNQQQILKTLAKQFDSYIDARLNSWWIEFNVHGYISFTEHSVAVIAGVTTAHSEQVFAGRIRRLYWSYHHGIVMSLYNDNTFTSNTHMNLESSSYVIQSQQQSITHSKYITDLKFT